MEDFIKKMSKVYELVIYTASVSKYADPLLDILDSERCVSYRLYKEHCTVLGKLTTKNLARLGRNLKDVIIVDNSPISYILQPGNAIPITSWIDNKNDDELAKLIPILTLLAKTNDARNSIAKIVKSDKVDYENAIRILEDDIKANSVIKPLKAVSSTNIKKSKIPNLSLKNLITKKYEESRDECSNNSQTTDRELTKESSEDKSSFTDTPISNVPQKSPKIKTKTYINHINEKNSSQISSHYIRNISNRQPILTLKDYGLVPHFNTNSIIPLTIKPYKNEFEFKTYKPIAVKPKEHFITNDLYNSAAKVIHNESKKQSPSRMTSCDSYKSTYGIIKVQPVINTGPSPWMRRAQQLHISSSLAVNYIRNSSNGSYKTQPSSAKNQATRNVGHYGSSSNIKPHSIQTNSDQRYYGVYQSPRILNRNYRCPFVKCY